MLLYLIEPQSAAYADSPYCPVCVALGFREYAVYVRPVGSNEETALNGGAYVLVGAGDARGVGYRLLVSCVYRNLLYSKVGVAVVLVVAGVRLGDNEIDVIGQLWVPDKGAGEPAVTWFVRPDHPPPTVIKDINAADSSILYDFRQHNILSHLQCSN